MKKLFFIGLLLSFAFCGKTQFADCAFKKPAFTIDFGAGAIPDLNTGALANYGRVSSSCPTDNHYAYTPSTSDCFRGDWLTLPQDHTPGDVNGNMLLVNASWDGGPFLITNVTGLKSNTTYEFAAWLMNVCRISDKCPFPLLPNLTIQLQTPAGNVITKINTGDLERRNVPHWTRHRALFTTPALQTHLILIMTDNNPGGCGNDFAVDDITFRECVKQTNVVTTSPKASVVAKQQQTKPRTAPKKESATSVKRQTQASTTEKPKDRSPVPATPVLKQRTPVFPAPPPVLTSRINTLAKQIETEEGAIRLDLYDNGEIDGDTVSIYHNNTLLVNRARLSQKPITLNITIDAANPHHEFIMVAENLGAIPPNTSLMIVTTSTQRYQVLISSNEQKNAKVVLNLKE